MIDRSSIEEMFVRARANYRWSIDAPCAWSFFFAGRDRGALVALGQALEAGGYRFAGLLEPTPQDDDQELLFAQLDRVEEHTVESLDARNQELARFAEQFPGIVYDGMDVGPVASIA